MSRKLPAGMTEKDIKLVEAFESALSDGLGKTMRILDAAGVKYEKRHVMSGIMTFFLASVAVLVKPESWDDMLGGLRGPEMMAQLREIEANAERKFETLRTARESGEVPAPASERDPSTLN